MTLWLLGIDHKDQVFCARGPFAEQATDEIYENIEDMERLYNMIGPNVALYPEPIRIEVVRTAHTQRYRE